MFINEIIYITIAAIKKYSHPDLFKIAKTIAPIPKTTAKPQPPNLKDILFKSTLILKDINLTILLFIKLITP